MVSLCPLHTLGPLVSEASLSLLFDSYSAFLKLCFCALFLNFGISRGMPHGACHNLSLPIVCYLAACWKPSLAMVCCWAACQKQSLARVCGLAACYKPSVARVCRIAACHFQSKKKLSLPLGRLPLSYLPKNAILITTERFIMKQSC